MMKYLLPVLFLAFVACQSESVDPIVPDDGEVVFTKQGGADPNSEANQDRITDNVWITRGNDGGQIFNIRINNSADKTESPEDTEWAIGEAENASSLTFLPFRQTVKPQDVVGKNLVVHLITDDIYLNVEFLSWSRNKDGGFSYIRDEVPGSGN